MTTKNPKKILITAAIDYTNDVIHIGHAYEKILADCISRYEKLKRGKENVFFVTGTDEHGSTNFKAAEKKGVSPKEHVDEISAKNRGQLDSLNVKYDRFIRTTDEDHVKVASEFFKKAYDNGDIYKDTYEGLYCEGCEAHKTITELNEDGQCPLHTTREIQKYEEENYFFKWTKYSAFLKELIETDKLLVRPEGKKREMLAFIQNGIHDIPITRPKFKLNWGITAPIDDEQVIYVWFDALINYVTCANEHNLWKEGVEIIHFVGKDIARWHVLLWPAMLKSVGYRLPDEVYVHGFINLEGEKISKSKGNVILPSDLVDEFGSDAVRYYFLKHGPVVEDVDISTGHFREVYNADLANGLGNIVARLAKLAENSGLSFEPTEITEDIWEEVWAAPLTEFRTDLAIQNIWAKIAKIDKHINDNEPWGIEDEEKLKRVLAHEIGELREVAKFVEPFIPEAARKIQEQFGEGKIKSGEPLFPRI